MKIVLISLFLVGFAFAKVQEAEIQIEGMTCPLCTMTIKKNLKNKNGVIKAKVKLNTQMAKVIYDDNNITKEQLLQAISEVGYSGKFKINKDIK
jgi:mercuric ion binding protein